MERVCTICARAGSKGVLNKNLRELAGKPLIAHSILQAQRSGCFSNIAVSSDSVEILKIAEHYGADLLVRRPEQLATDTAAKIPAIQHCAREAEALSGKRFDTIVDLDATSPLRSVEDIRACVEQLEQSGASNLITGMHARRSPYFNLMEIDEQGTVRPVKSLGKPLVRRQDAPQCYDMNASIYAWRRDALFEGDKLLKSDTILYVMPEERSIDIDSELDFQIVQFLAEKRGELW